MIIQNGNIPNSVAARELNAVSASMEINGKISNTGKSTITNYGKSLNVNATGNVSNTTSTLDMYNYGANGFNVANGGSINGNNTTILMHNEGADGLNTHGSVTAKGTGDINMVNTRTGTNGINIYEDSKITSNNNVNITNKATGRDTKT